MGGDSDDNDDDDDYDDDKISLHFKIINPQATWIESFTIESKLFFPDSQSETSNQSWIRLQLNILMYSTLTVLDLRNKTFVWKFSCNSEE